MSLKVTLEEKPRVFAVKVGCNEIGQVTSYFDPDCDDDEAYHAELYKKSDDEEDPKHLGWHPTIKAASLCVVEYSHGPTKIDKVKDRAF
jgi:hypothetical protein